MYIIPQKVITLSMLFFEWCVMDIVEWFCFWLLILDI